MKIFIGLGNPDDKFSGTRHNTGFIVLDFLCLYLTKRNKHPVLFKKIVKFNAKIIRIKDIILVKPLTFMNNSGRAVASLARFYKLKPDQVWVIHDEVDLPLGKIRIRLGGGTAGHRGLESIIRQWGEDQFVRFRLGIGAATGVAHATQEYVLAGFTSQQRSMVKKMTKKAIKAIQSALKNGLEKAQHEFN